MTVRDCYRSDYIFRSLTIELRSSHKSTVITLRPEAPDRISVVLCIALFIKLGVKYLLSAHSTNSCNINSKIRTCCKTITNMLNSTNLNQNTEQKSEHQQQYLWNKHRCDSTCHLDALAACKSCTWYFHKDSICKK
jgi:hypothetical protein